MEIRSLLIISALIFSFGIVIVGLGAATTPLVIAFVLAYLLHPVIERIERFGINRNYTVLGVFTLTSLFSVLILLAIIPDLWADAQELAKELPMAATKIIEKLEAVAANHGYTLNINKDSVNTFIIEHTSEISTALLQGISNAFKGLFGNALQWLLSILNLFLIPLFFFHLINDFEKISDGIKSWIPPVLRPKIYRYFELSNGVLNGYIRGQLLVAALLSLLYGVGLTIVGLKFGFLVGFLSGLLSIIPYVGFTLGFITSLLIGISNYKGIGGIVGIVTVFLLVQALEGTVITPKLVGNKVGLNALTTMLALIIGGNLFGLLGMLIAIPTAAVLKLLLLELKAKYQTLDLYRK